MSGFETHTLTIKRLKVTQDTSVGGQIRTHTTSERGALPKTVKGRPIRMTDKEKLDHGVRGERQGWKLLTLTNPKITLEDRVEFDYMPDEPVTMKVLVASHARIGGTAEAHHWTTIGEEDTTES